ncbi:hypothetical protein ACFHW0_03745 [Micromonospora sp. LOL_025]|uniref:hypothetical protein n=1 Tax=Micromonospora sp. LOL_025 TaxID=3345413 RepID=UPI003A8B3C5F
MPADTPRPAEPAPPADLPPPAGQVPPAHATPGAVGATGRREIAFAEAEQVSLPDWMRSTGAEHQPTGLDRVRFFWARHNGPLAVGVALALALLMLVVGGWMVVRVGDELRTATAAPTTSATPEPTSAVGTPRDLFAGTPAASFARREEAIVLPTATAEGPFDKVQVRAALDSVRKALIESRLETAMLVGDIEPFLGLLAPDSRAEMRPHFDNARFLHVATRMESRADWEYDIRAQGRISYRARTVAGIRLLEVTTEFVWAYPFDVMRRAPAGAGLVAVRDRVVWQVPHPKDVPASSRGLRLASAKAVTWNADCAWLRDGWLNVMQWLPDLHGPRVPGGDPGDFFDLAAPMTTTSRC